MWLDNSLRAKLDQKSVAEGRSLAGTIDFYLRKGLGLRLPGKDAAPEKTDATIFG
ncbi:hypothetical protein ACRQ5Q_24490 [Bradyrhizobium sp. PMVTL-01]|uniref:hypothetical protein n=1 Tax=Bradyrhizobium sp. PMVTL-01 TaxID=3434999 RepID=UPI003F6ED4A7